jgi:hemerythrin
MDRQHKHLIDLINNLHEQMLAGEANAVLGQLLDSVLNYTATHFAAEEALMARMGYPGLARHRAEHEELTHRATNFAKEWRAGRMALSTHVANF